MVARLSPGNRHGRVFGGYGAFKSLGYATGPVVGGLLITTGGYTLLFATLAGLALAVTGWAALAVPTVSALPRARQTVLDLARRLGSAAFLRPTMPWPARPPPWPSGWGSSRSSAVSPG